MLFPGLGENLYFVLFLHNIMMVLQFCWLFYIPALLDNMVCVVAMTAINCIVCNPKVLFVK